MKLKGLNRREFLALTSLGVTGAYFALHSGLARAMMGSGGGMGGGGGTSVINPPPGALFRDPVEALKNSYGIYELEVREAQVNVNGTLATLLTYNGQFPGPTIRARRGETLRAPASPLREVTEDVYRTDVRFRFVNLIKFNMNVVYVSKSARKAMKTSLTGVPNGEEKTG